MTPRTTFTTAIVSVCYFVGVYQALSDVSMFRCVTEKFYYACDTQGCTKQVQAPLIYLFKVDIAAMTGTVQTCETAQTCEKIISKLINVESSPSGGFRAAISNLGAMGTVAFSVTPTKFSAASVIDGTVSADIGRCSSLR